ncbi:MAG: TetR/AcrR family transcriptional regulator [Ensifer alkalisoli]|nr:TetR/AcrR family transcriptional regulator [Sinorhizobium alkalisoli]
MARVDVARRAKIGRDRRAKTRAQILEAGATLFAEGAPLTADAVAEAAGVAKGTFYYHFDNVEALVGAVIAQVERSLDDVLTHARSELRDPIARLSSTFAQSLERAISDSGWARLVVQTSKTPREFGRSVRDHLIADIAEAIAQGRMTVRDPELAADIFVGIWLQVTRGILERVAPPELSRQALEAALRALGSVPPNSRNV